MPDNFDLDGYEPQGDEDFPWFPNMEIPLPGEAALSTAAPLSDAGVGAQGVVANQGSGSAKGASSASTTEDPPAAA